MCLDTRWRCVEGEKYPFNWIGGWLGPTTELHAVEKKKITMSAKNWKSIHVAHNLVNLLTLIPEIRQQNCS